MQLQLYGLVPIVDVLQVLLLHFTVITVNCNQVQVLLVAKLDTVLVNRSHTVFRALLPVACNRVAI